MMEYVILWYVAGLIGSALVLEFGWRRDRDMPLDIEVQDLIFGAGLALGGGFVLLIGLLLTLGWFLCGALGRIGVDGARVVFRAKRK